MTSPSKLTHGEWKSLHDLVSHDYAQHGGPIPLELLLKIDWHIADTYDAPMDDGRQWPQAENE